MIYTLVVSFTAAMLFDAACANGQDDRSPLGLEKEIPLAGVEGRIDHCSVDVPGKRIFIAALGNGTVEVVDLAKGERTEEIIGLKEPQGLYYDDATSRLYVASAGNGTLRVYEGKSLTLLSTLELGDDADNVRYDENSGQIWVGYGNGGLGVIAAGEKAGEIPLGSHPESFQLEHGGSRVFVNVPKEFGVAVVDRAKHAVISKWGLGRTFANYPMALDERDGRLFVGCQLPCSARYSRYELGTSSRKIAGRGRYGRRVFRSGSPPRLRNWWRGRGGHLSDE